MPHPAQLQLRPKTVGLEGLPHRLPEGREDLAFVGKANFGLGRVHVHVHFPRVQKNVDRPHPVAAGRDDPHVGGLDGGVEAPVLNPAPVNEEGQVVAGGAVQDWGADQAGYGQPASTTRPTSMSWRATPSPQTSAAALLSWPSPAVRSRTRPSEANLNSISG
jgi:hypothetical protein